MEKVSKYLHDDFTYRAWGLWLSGNDTFDIAIKLKCPEHQVYNTLAMIRDQLEKD